MRESAAGSDDTGSHDNEPDDTIRMLGAGRASTSRRDDTADVGGDVITPRHITPGDVLDDETLLALHDAPTLPWMRANFVSSVDGAATHDGRSAGLGSAADHRLFHLLRRLADVIIVGAGTVRIEGYAGSLLRPEDEQWRLDHGLTAHPEFAIVSHTLDLDPASALFTDAVRRPLLIAPRQAPQQRRAALAEVAEVIDCGEVSVDLVEMRRMLAGRGLVRQHSEGGPTLFTAMVAAGVVDELCLTMTPLLEAGPAGRITAALPPDAADIAAQSPQARSTDAHSQEISDDAPGGPAATRRAIQNLLHNREAGRPLSVPLHLAHTLAADDGTLLLRYLRRD